MGKPQAYKKYLMEFFEKNYLMELRSQLEAGDYESAFHTLHAMKGVCGNPLY